MDDRNSLLFPACRRNAANGLKKDSSARHFWRAFRFLYPYRGMVAISITCAIIVSLTNTAGLSAMLPIMRVLVKGDTISSWADREIAQHRLGLKFSDETKDLVIVKLTPSGAAFVAGLHEQDSLFALPANTRPDLARLLSSLSDPNASMETVHLRDGGDVNIRMPWMPRYLVVGRKLAGRFPTHPVKAIAIAFGLIAALAVFFQYR